MERKKIKVLHIMQNIGIGGINRFIIDLCSNLVKLKDIELGIYVCSQKNNSWKNQFEGLSNIKLYFGNTTTNYYSIYNYIYFRKIARNYDVVHWHVFNPILMLYTLNLRVKNIFTHHSVFGTLRSFTLKERIKWRLFKFYVFHYFDYQIFNSGYTLNFWKKNKSLSNNYKIIYNGIIFKGDVKDQTYNNDSFIIGTSSALIKWKRVDVLIKCFSIFCKNKGDVKLLIVGDGPERLNLVALTEKLGIDDKVLFTGFQNDVKLFQEKMDVCVFPSITETFGLAAAECLYLGKPTICFEDGGGICELIGMESFNIVKDENDLVNKLNYYYGVKKRLGTCYDLEYHNRALLFDMKDKSNEYVEIYKHLV